MPSWTRHTEFYHSLIANDGLTIGYVSSKPGYTWSANSIYNHHKYGFYTMEEAQEWLINTAT